MPQQPNLFSPDPSEPGLQPRRKTSHGSAMPERHHAWLARTELLVRVIVRLYVGLLIIALPWLRFWTENGLLHASRGLSLLAGSGALRGMVSGLGLLNVVIAVRELFARRAVQ